MTEIIEQRYEVKLTFDVKCNGKDFSKIDLEYGDMSYVAMNAIQNEFAEMALRINTWGNAVARGEAPDLTKSLPDALQKALRE